MFSHYEPCPQCQQKGNDTRGDNLAIYKDGGCHCFGCGYHRNPKFVVPEHLLKKDDHRGSKVLPHDFTREVPGAAWKWLLQYGLSYRYWKDKVGWSEYDSRLVFTVGEPTEFSIGRHIPYESHGELAVAPRKWFVWGESHRTPHIFNGDIKGPYVLGDKGPGARIVLVEDLISAHKVGHVQPAMPLFGTKVFDACIPVLRHLRLPITLWLDQDQQGNIVKKASNLSVLTGLPVTYLFTERDPKSLTFEQIERNLK